MFPFGQFEEIGKQNMALFERAMRMLSPAALDPNARDSAEAGAAGETKAGGTSEPAKPASEDPRLRRLEAQIEELRLQLSALNRGRDDG
jgi:polyhydroxyalkanoate synthesis regulator protein